MQSIADAITRFFSNGTDAIGAFVAAMSLIGIASSAIVQLVKDLTPARSQFHRWRLRLWVAKRTQGTIETATSELYRLAIDGEENVLLALPIEDLCAQLSAAARLAVDNPLTYCALLRALVLTKNADIDVLIELERRRGQGLSDADRVALAEARGRVWSQLQRSIEAFQLATADLWSRIIKGVCFVVSMSLAWVALGLQSSPATVSPLAVVSTAILAGFLAPVARDLTTAVAKLRGDKK